MTDPDLRPDLPASDRSAARANGPSRRALLTVGATGAGVALLAACSGGSGSAGTTSDPMSGTAADDADRPDSPSTSGTSSAASSSGAAPAASGHELTKLADVKQGEAVSVKLADGKPGLVARTGADTAVCFSATCPHQGCTVKPDGAKLACPCHGSMFDAKTGDRLAGPAPHGLEKIAVTVTDGAVVAKD